MAPKGYKGLSEEQRKEILHLAGLGYSIRGIAGEVGVSKSALHEWVTVGDLREDFEKAREDLKVDRYLPERSTKDVLMAMEPEQPAPVRYQSSFPSAEQCQRMYPAPEPDPAAPPSISEMYSKYRVKIRPDVLRASMNGGIPRALLVSRDPRDTGRGEEGER